MKYVEKNSLETRTFVLKSKGGTTYKVVVKELDRKPTILLGKDQIGPSHFTGFDVNLIRQVVNEGVVMLKYLDLACN